MWRGSSGNSEGGLVGRAAKKGLQLKKEGVGHSSGLIGETDDTPPCTQDGTAILFGALRRVGPLLAHLVREQPPEGLPELRHVCQHVPVHAAGQAGYHM